MLDIMQEASGSTHPQCKPHCALHAHQAFNHLRKLDAVHSTFLPFFLRAFRTSRPLGVRMRALKPLVLVRALQRAQALDNPCDSLPLQGCTTKLLMK